MMASMSGRGIFLWKLHLLLIDIVHNLLEICLDIVDLSSEADDEQIYLPSYHQHGTDIKRNIVIIHCLYDEIYDDWLQLS